MSDGHRPTDAPAPSRRSGPEKRRVTVRPDGTPLPRPTVHAPGSTCGADAQEARRPNVSRGPCSRPRPRLSAAAIVRQDRAPRRRPGPPADAMASLDACVPQPGHKVKMHAWMAAARWPLGMPGTRNVPPAPPLSAPTGKIRPFPAAGAKKGVRRCAAPFLCAMETKEFQRFGIHAPKWSAFKPAPTGRCARFSEVRVGRGHASSCPVFLA